MITLLLLILFGLGVGYFATQNVIGIPITLAGYTIEGTPLYIIVVGSLLLGVAISWIISLMRDISSSVALHGKDTALKSAHKTIEELKDSNYKLEVENAKLRGKPHEQIAMEDGREHPSVLHQLKHAFGIS